MQGSRALGSAAVVILIFAAFMVGRASVSPTETRAPAEATPTARPQKLSAIIPARTDGTGLPERQRPSAATQPTDPAPEAQIDANLATVANFLSTAAGQIGDNGVLAETIAAWMDHDPDEAINWLANGDRGAEILPTMFVIWGQQNPSAALAWLAANRDTDRYPHAAFGLAGNLESEEALQLAETLNDPPRRATIWTVAGRALYADDQDAALERLAAAEFPDELERLTINSWRQALSNKSKRNAQNLASVFSAAVAAGAEFQGNSSEEITRELVAGVTGAGPFATTRFQVPTLSDTEIAHAIENLEFAGQNQLNYNPAPEEDL